MFQRSSGVLLHVTSLPGPYGIGDLGPSAHAWVNWLAEAGCSYWQMLPLGPTGFADSPYSPFSSFAGNPNLISPELLAIDGLLSEDEIVGFSRSKDANGRFSFIPDYEMTIASNLVQGCDVWLNNPILPREASGTSGEKLALNGGLNCSILDGWWSEMFDGQNGWAIPASQETEPELRDLEDSTAVTDTLLAVREEYYESREVFNGRVRHAWRTLGPKVTAARMLRDYETRLYQPARSS